MAQLTDGLALGQIGGVKLLLLTRQSLTISVDNFVKKSSDNWPKPASMRVCFETMKY